MLALGLDDATCTYGLFHALGLYHSFSDLNLHTFKEYKTDNIMDCFDIGPEKNTSDSHMAVPMGCSP